jgi:PAS domain S-box-containing protein
MPRSLRLQVLWAPLVTLALGAAALALEAHNARRMAARYEAVTRMRHDLDRVIWRVTELHLRTVRRAREALLDPDPENQVRVLSRTSEHYLSEIKRHLARASRVTGAVAVPDARPRLATDLRRLQESYDRLAERAHAFAPTLDALLEAIAAEDPDLLLEAEVELDRTDKEMQAALRITARVAQVTAKMQADHAVTPITPVPFAAWIALLLATPLSFWLAYRPLARVSSLARGESTTARSKEEELLARRLAALAADRDELERSLSERTRDAERSAQTSRRAEQELALLRLYNENLVNSLRSAIVVTDAAGTITGFNRAARQLLGIAGDDVGRQINGHALFTSLARRTDAAADLERALTDRQVLRFEGVPFPSSGGERLLDLTVAPYQDESGAARGLLWVTDDVTDEVRIKKQLLAAERLAAVGSLSAQVAHEIRNPLSAIGLNAELLEEEFAAGLSQPRRGEAAALLGAIASEIERLTHVTEGYLRLARMPSPDFANVDLNLVVTDLLNMLDEELKTHGITPILDLATPPPQAHADPGQLRQALINIVRNSREAMVAGGELRVSTRRALNDTVIEVTDTGPGIPHHQAERVFEPFYTTKPDGTGLGLSLTHQIVAEHGGTVEVLSSPPGGTTIRISLPVTPS